MIHIGITTNGIHYAIKNLKSKGVLDRTGLLKRIIWAQVGEIKGKNILDFGSEEGVITANRLFSYLQLAGLLLDIEYHVKPNVPRTMTT